MLCVATFRWFCHFAEWGYLIVQVQVTHFLRQPYKILTDSLVSLYPPRLLVLRIFRHTHVFHYSSYEISIRSLAWPSIPKVLDFSSSVQGNPIHRMPAAGGEGIKTRFEIWIETDLDLWGCLTSTQGLDYTAPQRTECREPCSQRYEQRRDYQGENSTGKRRLD